MAVRIAKSERTLLANVSRIPFLYFRSLASPL